MDRAVLVRVDQHNRICEVGGEWMQAAQDGDAIDTLVPEKVLGKSLFAFIASDSTRMYYETLLKLCRLQQHRLEREYRCDSSTHQRWMRLTLIPSAQGAVDMQHVLIRQQPFNHPLHIAESTTSSTRTRTNHRCSLCNQIRLAGHDSWAEPADLVQDAARAFLVIHTVCPRCASSLSEGLTPILSNELKRSYR